MSNYLTNDKLTKTETLIINDIIDIILEYYNETVICIYNKISYKYNIKNNVCNDEHENFSYIKNFDTVVVGLCNIVDCDRELKDREIYIVYYKKYAEILVVVYQLYLNDRVVAFKCSIKLNILSFDYNVDLAKYILR